MKKSTQWFVAAILLFFAAFVFYAIKEISARNAYYVGLSGLPTFQRVIVEYGNVFIALFAVLGIAFSLLGYSKR
jgi:hypothetical protein